MLCMTVEETDFVQLPSPHQHAALVRELSADVQYRYRNAGDAVVLTSLHCAGNNIYRPRSIFTNHLTDSQPLLPRTHNHRPQRSSRHSPRIWQTAGMSDTDAHDHPPPYILEPQDASSGKPASFIFLHGYGDDAEGLPQGLAQQFQFYNKMPYLRWVLPNAAFNRETMNRAWYLPKALPNSLKPRVPGQQDDEEKWSEWGDLMDSSNADDEEGILNACRTVDELVQGELDRGVEPGRIVVGGFSQGCAVSLVWGLTGKRRKNVGGICCLSGYFPLASRIAELRKERGIEESDKGKDVQWFYIHGNKDVLVPTRLFTAGKEELGKWIDAPENLEEHLYDGMGHSTNNALLRDLLKFLSRVAPP